MTFEAGLAHIEMAVREHGAVLGELAGRFGSGAISKEQVVAEMASLRAGAVRCGNGLAARRVRKNRARAHPRGQG